MRRSVAGAHRLAARPMKLRSLRCGSRRGSAEGFQEATCWGGVPPSESCCLFSQPSCPRPWRRAESIALLVVFAAVGRGAPRGDQDSHTLCAFARYCCYSSLHPRATRSRPPALAAHHQARPDVTPASVGLTSQGDLAPLHAVSLAHVQEQLAANGRLACVWASVPKKMALGENTVPTIGHDPGSWVGA
jgi:hypothetical protein